MARKRLRKPTKINVTVENLDRPEVPAHSPPDRPREPEHTATFWRNTYEAERSTRDLMGRHLRREREEVAKLKEENERLRAEIERHSKDRTSIDDESRVVSRPVRKRVRASH